MSERCDLSDLPVEMCACRLHGPAEEKVAPSVGPVIFARYPGRCGTCDDAVHAGDPIRCVTWESHHGIVHEGCEP